MKKKGSIIAALALVLILGIFFLCKCDGTEKQEKNKSQSVVVQKTETDNEQENDEKVEESTATEFEETTSQKSDIDNSVAKTTNVKKTSVDQPLEPSTTASGTEKTKDSSEKQSNKKNNKHNSKKQNNKKSDDSKSDDSKQNDNKSNDSIADDSKQEDNKNDDSKTENNKPAILDKGIAADEAGVLSYIPNDAIEEQLMQQIYIFKGNMLSSAACYDTNTESNIQKLRILSLDIGEVLYETDIANIDMANVQVCGDFIAVSDAQNGIIYVLNDKLEKVNEYSVIGDVVYVNTALTEAYCFVNGSELRRVQLNSGKTSSILTDVYDLYASVQCGNYISMSYIGGASGLERYCALNLETGELERQDLKVSLLATEYNGGIWKAELTGENGCYLLGTQDNPYKFNTPFEGASINLLDESSRLIIKNYEIDGKQGMSIYDTDGICLSSCVLNDLGYGPIYNPIWSESAGGYFFTIIDQAGYDKLYFWDISVEGVEEENLELKSFYEDDNISGDKVPQEYYERAAAIGEQYGMTIKIADQCVTDYDGFIVEQVLDTSQIETGLDILENALSSYPENFFQQIYYGSCRTMEINLMGEITSKEYIENYWPVAFVSLGNKITMVLNITCDETLLKQNFYHETSHIIDKKLEYDARYREGALYSEEAWEALNPEGFPGYYGSYGVLPDEYLAEEFNPYFIDLYAMTKATEDRARIFEYAAIGKSIYFKEEIFYGRRAKLEYYCECIRDAFDTTGWPETTIWEEGLLDNGDSGDIGKG